MSRGWVVVALLLVAAPSPGAELQTCYGYSVRWQRSPTLEFDACAVDDTRVREQTWGPARRWSRRRAFIDMIEAWNTAGGSWARLQTREGPRCGYRSGDGRNTMTYVEPGEIGGAFGLTLLVYDRHCWRFGGRQWISEVDVLISTAHERRDGRVLDPYPPCDQQISPTERVTVLHELGHALGLHHSPDPASVMREGGGELRYCGARPFAPMPDDLDGLRRLYGDGRAFVDLAASSHRLRDHGAIDVVGLRDGDEPRETLTACPGALFSAQYTAANVGTLPSDYRVRWLASLDATPSADDVLLGFSVGRLLPTGALDSPTVVLPMSARLMPATAYRLLFLLEPRLPWNQERRQGNNHSVVFGSIVRRPPGECP